LKQEVDGCESQPWKTGHTTQQAVTDSGGASRQRPVPVTDAEGDGLTGSALASERVSPNALEPAINGAVSDDGLYPSQGLKRQALGS
jgi:hypothetical protein